MTKCLWCGRPSDGAAACLRCAPGQGYARDLEHDAVFEPSLTYLDDVDNLRETLRYYGVEPIPFEPLEDEWADLNEQRFLAELERGTSAG